MRDSLYSIEDWVRFGDERRPLLVDQICPRLRNYVLWCGPLRIVHRLQDCIEASDLEIEILERTNRCGGTIETWSKENGCVMLR